MDSKYLEVLEKTVKLAENNTKVLEKAMLVVSRISETQETINNVAVEINEGLDSLLLQKVPEVNE